MTKHPKQSKIAVRKAKRGAAGLQCHWSQISQSRGATRSGRGAPDSSSNTGVWSIPRCDWSLPRRDFVLLSQKLMF